MSMAVLGCGDKAEVQSPEEKAQELVAHAMNTAAGQGGDENLAPVEVTAQGTRFDPPVQISQIPDGAWFCDMGTVHYARTEKGDGRCAVCGMRLSQRGEANDG